MNASSCCQKLVATNERIRISNHQIGNGLSSLKPHQQWLGGSGSQTHREPISRGQNFTWLKFKSVKEKWMRFVGGWTDHVAAGNILAACCGPYRKIRVHYRGSLAPVFQIAERKLYQNYMEIRPKEVSFLRSSAKRASRSLGSAKVKLQGRIRGVTSDNHLRQPRFLGLQPDRDPRESTFSRKERLPPSCRIRLSLPASQTRQTRAFCNCKDNKVRVCAICNGKDKKIRVHTGCNPNYQGPRTTTQEQVRAEIGGREFDAHPLNKIYFPKAGYTSATLSCTTPP